MIAKLPNIRRRRVFGFYYFLTIAIAFGAIRASHAQPSWDIVGNWNINYVVENGTGSLSFTVTNENLQTGAFGAWDPAHNQSFSGTVSGSNINFSDYQTDNNGFGPFLNVLSIEGSIATNGTLSGPMDQDNGGTDWHGSFWTVSGQAMLYAGPVFTLQPVNQVVNSGQPVTFMAAASGYPAPAYQWQFNGTNILGATNTSFSMLQPGVANLGLYDVVASNVAGTNASANASLSFLDIRCIPSLILYGPVGVSYDIQEATSLGGGTNWTTITNVTLTPSQPYIFTDSTALTNSGSFYRAVPQ